MILTNKKLFNDNVFNIDLLLNAEERPDLFSVEEELFWDDPYISKQMLKAHLTSDSDAASRTQNTINQTVNWIVKYLMLQQGSKILDLGCGPGLYCKGFSRHGFTVTGIDYSKNSINYAVNDAAECGLDVEYIYKNYLTMDYSCEFDVITMIYCDFGALSDLNRSLLLQKIHKALKPDGIFIFDVFTSANREKQPSCNWYASNAGFWKPDPHLVLEKTYHYTEENVFLNRYTIIDNTGTLSIYNLWDHCYTPESISGTVKEYGFAVTDIWGDLTGKPYQDNSKIWGIAARKMGT